MLRWVDKNRRADKDGVDKGRDLKCMWGVVDAVDTEAVVQGEAGCTGGEQRQLQPFAGGMWRAGLAHQAVSSQLLHENMTAFLLQLQVARWRQSFLSYCQHILKRFKKRSMTLPFTTACLSLGASQRSSHLPSPLVRLCLECEGPVRCRCV